MAVPPPPLEPPPPLLLDGATVAAWAAAAFSAPAWRWPPPGLRQLQPPAAGPPGWRSALHLVEGGALLALRRLRRLLAWVALLAALVAAFSWVWSAACWESSAFCAVCRLATSVPRSPSAASCRPAGPPGSSGCWRRAGWRWPRHRRRRRRRPRRSQRHLVAGHLRLVGVDLRLCASDLSSESCCWARRRRTAGRLQRSARPSTGSALRSVGLGLGVRELVGARWARRRKAQC